MSSLLSMALRARFVFTPLTADEGGFLAIARAWRGGADLYSTVWVDRPQGLLAVFAGWDTIAGGNTQSVRVLAVLFGAAAVIACATIGRALAGPTAGALAALFAAVLSSSPQIEGFIANGELLSGTCSAISIAVGCLALTGRLRMRAMIVAGLAAGVAVSIKQSGFDGYAVLATWLVLAAMFSWRPRRSCSPLSGC
jgi:hypothetical protein